MLAAKPANTHEQNHKLALATGDDIDDLAQFRRFFGRLIYLTVITKPELSYCVYIPGQDISLRANCDLRFYAYCDSDWVDCLLTRRFLTGYFALLRNSPISWKTKKQDTMSCSSAEVEYRYMTTTACELKWLKEELASLGVELSNILIVWVCIVTASQLCTLLLISFIMKEPSTLK